MSGAVSWLASLRAGDDVVVAHGGYGTVSREAGKVAGFTKTAIKVQTGGSSRCHHYSRRTGHKYSAGSAGGSYQGWLEESRASNEGPHPAAFGGIE